MKRPAEAGLVESDGPPGSDAARMGLNYLKLHRPVTAAIRTVALWGGISVCAFFAHTGFGARRRT